MLFLSYRTLECDGEEFLCLDGKFHREFVHHLLGISVDY